MKLKGSKFKLVRDSDGEGDEGDCLVSIHPVSLEHKPCEILVGYLVQCGSKRARTMSWQDYWMTTPVVEILEATNKKVRFTTKNSTYTLTFK